MDIREVDPHDGSAFAQWFAVVDAAEQHERPGEPASLLHEQHQTSLNGAKPDTDLRMELLAAVEGGAVVGAARLELPQRDNLHLCEVELAVHPDVRRRGIGRALVQEVERRVLGHGRSTVLAYADEPPGSEGASTGRRAAVALGYSVCQEEVRRDIEVPVDPARAAALERDSALHARDYRVLTWWDSYPDEYAGDRAALGRAMSTDIPKDEMDWREERWDVPRVRRAEALAAAMDRTFVCGVAQDLRTERLVAYTEMGLPRSAPRRAYQWDTLVLREHRGHRLGMLVKLAALQELHAKWPQTEYISTWNAQENVPMIAVNDALGARTNGGIAALQKVLA